MTRFQAIIFDLDDTLYPEKSYVFSGYRAVADYIQDKWEFSSDSVFEELRCLFDNGNRNHTFDAWVAVHQLEPDLTAKLVEIYRHHSPRIQLFSGMRQLLATTSEAAKIGLISDGHLNVQCLKFSALDIEPFFDSVIFSDLWGREHWKPAERPYREALSSLGLRDASRAVYVGDNPNKDFITPRALGMHTIQLRHTEGGIYHDQVAPTLGHEPDVVVTTVDALTTELS